jgi:hypothetical protein
MFPKNIFVAIPCYSGEIQVQTMVSLLQSMEEARDHGWTIKAENVLCRMQDADIGQARNAYLGAFLATDCTDLWFIDADISWGKGVFPHLFSHEADFVAGAYRSKIEEIKYPIIWPEQRSIHVDPRSQKPLMPVDGVPAGFIRLSRTGVEKINKAAPRHFHDKFFKVDCPWVFEFAWHGDQRMSEDYHFCKLWREHVGPVHLDPSLCVDHTGKYTYLGDIYSWMRGQVQSAEGEQGVMARAKMLIGAA